MTAAFPFAGVFNGRPYPPTGLTTARWTAEVPTREVRFGSLWLTQPHVITVALFGITDRPGDQDPHVVAWRDLLLLEDGHNRVVRAALVNRAASMPMRVFKV